MTPMNIIEMLEVKGASSTEISYFLGQNLVEHAGVKGMKWKHKKAIKPRPQPPPASVSAPKIKSAVSIDTKDLDGLLRSFGIDPPEKSTKALAKESGEQFKANMNLRLSAMRKRSSKGKHKKILKNKKRMGAKVKSGRNSGVYVSKVPQGGWK